MLEDPTWRSVLSLLLTCRAVRDALYALAHALRLTRPSQLGGIPALGEGEGAAPSCSAPCRPTWRPFLRRLPNLRAVVRWRAGTNCLGDVGAHGALTGALFLNSVGPRLTAVAQLAGGLSPALVARLAACVHLAALRLLVPMNDCSE